MIFILVLIIFTVAYRVVFIILKAAYTSVVFIIFTVAYRVVLIIFKVAYTSVVLIMLEC